MSSYALAPVGEQQFCDENGVPLAGGFVYTYTAGTSTPQATYTDATGDTPNTNPVVLDSTGRAALWLSSGSYKFVVADVNNNIQYTTDNISVITSGNVPGSPQDFTIADNQSSAQNITGMSVAHATNQCMVIEYTILRTDGTNYRREHGYLYLTYDRQNGWILNRQSQGADAFNMGANSLSITTGGQVQYETDSMGGSYSGQMTWQVYSSFPTESFA